MAPPPEDGDTDAQGATGSACRTVSARRRRRLWPLLVILAAMLALYASGLHEAISLEAVIREHEVLARRVAEHRALALLVYVAAYTLAVALSFPGASLITVLGGFLFGVATGTVLTVLAATAGAVVVFLAARSGFGEALRARAGRFAQRFAEGFEANAFSYLLFLRLVPLFPFWLVNVAPALFRVRLSTYVAATMLGIVPGTFAFTLFGDGLDALIAAQERANPGCAAAGTCRIDVGALFSPLFMAALVVLALAALLPVALKRHRGRAPAA